MRAAIYARYSSENQSEKSIDDQVRVCKGYAQDHELTISDEHIYKDEAISGSLLARPGLQALEKATESLEFEALLVDDLSRLSRSNYQMLTLVLKFNYYQIRIISVADGINTEDENSKLGIQMRGYSVGERVYGYITKPAGGLIRASDGQAKYDGMVHWIQPEEAIVVMRIFREFAEGASIHNIVRKLNEDKALTRKNVGGTWRVQTVSRILRNEKYIGVWDWRKTKSIRDPFTGKKKAIFRPAKEIIPSFREDLIIIDKSTWEKAQKRWLEIKGAYPVRKKHRSLCGQKSYIHQNPKHLFSGYMKCGICNSTLALVSGKGGGYYGCQNAKTKRCQNSLIVSRKKTELNIMSAIRENILNVSKLNAIYANLEASMADRRHAIPAILKEKETELGKARKELDNCLNFIKAGNGSKSIADAISNAEELAEKVSSEIESLRLQEKEVFKAPDEEWIASQIEYLRVVLDITTCTPFAIREMIGPILMKPMAGAKPYYVAEIRILVSSLLEDRWQRLYKNYSEAVVVMWNIR